MKSEIQVKQKIKQLKKGLAEVRANNKMAVINGYSILPYEEKIDILNWVLE